MVKKCADCKHYCDTKVKAGKVEEGKCRLTGKNELKKGLLACWAYLPK